MSTNCKYEFDEQNRLIQVVILPDDAPIEHYVYDDVIEQSSDPADRCEDQATESDDDA